MIAAVLFLELLVLSRVARALSHISADCGKDLSLACQGVKSVDFVWVTWYQLLNGKRIAIYRVSKKGEVKKYNFSRMFSPDRGHGLLLPAVSPGDTGAYECAISAAVGKQNVNTRVNLQVNECVTPTSVYDTTVLQAGERAPLDLPVMFTTLGCLAVGLVKMILSILVIKALLRSRTPGRLRR